MRWLVIVLLVGFMSAVVISSCSCDSSAGCCPCRKCTGGNWKRCSLTSPLCLQNPDNSEGLSQECNVANITRVAARAQEAYLTANQGCDVECNKGLDVFRKSCETPNDNQTTCRFTQRLDGDEENPADKFVTRYACMPNVCTDMQNVKAFEAAGYDEGEIIDITCDADKIYGCPCTQHDNCGDCNAALCAWHDDCTCRNRCLLGFGDDPTCVPFCRNDKCDECYHQHSCTECNDAKCAWHEDCKCRPRGLLDEKYIENCDDDKTCPGECWVSGWTDWTSCYKYGNNTWFKTRYRVAEHGYNENCPPLLQQMSCTAADVPCHPAYRINYEKVLLSKADCDVTNPELATEHVKRNAEVYAVMKEHRESAQKSKFPYVLAASGVFTLATVVGVAVVIWKRKHE